MLDRTLLHMMLQSLQQLKDANCFDYGGAAFKDVGCSISDRFVTQIIAGMSTSVLLAGCRSWSLCVFLALVLVTRYLCQYAYISKLLAFSGLGQIAWLFTSTGTCVLEAPTTSPGTSQFKIVNACIYICPRPHHYTQSKSLVIPVTSRD